MLKFFLIIVLAGADGSYKNHELVEQPSLQHCHEQLPVQTEQQLQNGNVLIYRCVIQQGA